MEFLSTPSARRATNQSTTALTPLVFLSTPSARRATSVLWAMTNWHRYFYPRPPRGGRRRGNGGTACGSKNFYPRPPRGGRRARWNPLVLIPVFLSTPSARRATAIDVSGQIGRQISIHALREEGDGFWAAQRLSTTVFLSTPSARRATPGRLTFAISDSFLSTPSARRATEGSEGNYKYYIFLSTPSARRATSYASASKSCEHDFYPRPPRGGRLRVDKDKLDAMQFLSTPSARRATGTVRVHLPGLQISIHALREEGDRW